MKKGIWGLVFTAFFALVILAMMFSSCSSQYSLSISSSPLEGGQITPSSGNFDKQALVNVIANPASGYRFDHWEGSIYKTSPSLSVLMDGNKELIAFFTKVYTVNAFSSPTDGGNISPVNGAYDSGEQVTLMATPAEGYKFKGWGGDASGDTNQLTITVDSNKQIVASFIENTRNLKTQVEPSGGGSVNPSNDTFEVGTSAVVTAIPSNGYRFDHWGGNAAGYSNPVNILMDTDKTITAYFIKVYTLDISSSSPDGIVKVIPDTHQIDAGTKATLTATTSVFPFGFDHWTGTDNDNVNPTTVTMKSDKTVNAYFKQLTPTIHQSKSSYIVLNNGSPAKISEFQLKAGQWVQGQLTGHLYELSAQIVDSHNNVVMDFGQSSFSTFQFQAPSTDSYFLVINDIHSTDYNYLMLEYTIYS